MQRTRPLVTGAVLLGLVAVTATSVASATGSAPAPYAGAVADAPCAHGDLPETVQGRVTVSEVTNGRAARGYECNTELVSRYGAAGGFHVFRYADHTGHVCAYYDTTLLSAADKQSAGRGTGTYVLDMTHSAQPVLSTVLRTPAMVVPHESLRLNTRRGLLAAVAGSPQTAPGVVDLYDVSKDCRSPQLRSSTPLGLLGHESGFAPDGKTFWTSSTETRGGTLAALDVSDPASPQLLFLTAKYILHGMSLSDDGRTLYAADQSPNSGLRIFDVSDVQDRKALPQIREVSLTTWPQLSIPQYADPVTIGGHPYAVEMDEFAFRSQDGRGIVGAGTVGAGRIIDLAHPAHPHVVSNLRLAVHQGAPRAAAGKDNGTSSFSQGYAGHYCSVPRRANPNLVACSMILSGLRLFDIRNPAKPVEVGYFNAPQPADSTDGARAMSAPAWDLAHDQVWYSDGDRGFYAVHLTGAAAAALHGTSPVPTGKPGTR